MIAMPSSAFTPLVPVKWQLAVSLAFVVLAVGISAARQPQYRRFVAGFGLAVIFAVVFGAVAGVRTMPVIDCDYFWWTLECMLKP